MEAKLLQIEQNGKITSTSNPKFWFAYQRAVLLALKELELLDEVQCRSAEEILRNQYGPSLEDSYG